MGRRLCGRLGMRPFASRAKPRLGVHEDRLGAPASSSPDDPGHEAVRPVGGSAARMVNEMRCPIRASALVVGVLLSLSGCAGGGYYDDSFTKDDAVGSWVSRDTPSEIILTLADSGEYDATGWPATLRCNNPSIEQTRDSGSLWSETVDYSGDWDMSFEGVAFVSSAPECPSNWRADAWKLADGSTNLRINLAPRDIDVVVEDHFIYFVKE